MKMPEDERMKEPKKVVVIGGAGFLGSHLADSLSDNGYRVKLYDINESPYLRPNQEMVVGNIQDLNQLSEAIKDCHYAYHLAGIADIDEAASNPRETVIRNIVGSTNVIEACVKTDVEKLIFASTVYVYSDKGSFYRVSKQAVELLLENYSRECGLNYTIIRYGSVYGPRSQDWNGIKRFVVQAVNDKRILYPGTGDERREYIHVADAASLSIKALDKKFNNQCLTLTGTQVMTTRQMLTMLVEIMNEDVKLEFDPSGSTYDLFHYQMTPYRYTPKLGQKLVLDCFTDLGQGILEMIDEVKQSGPMVSATINEGGEN